MIVATLIFGATLLLVPFIGGEFMPHLDEGALWVRATMPYTISFEEASKFAPQIRNILMSYPQVTEVGSELGRPDDGTDPTGFFNCEFYVGPEALQDKAWKQGPIRNKAELTEDLQKKLDAYPGVIFNLHAAGRRRRGRSADRTQERARRENLRTGSAGARRQGGRNQARSLAGSRVSRS